MCLLIPLIRSFRSRADCALDFGVLCVRWPFCFVEWGKFDSQGEWTVLMVAAENGHAACVRLLIDAGADMEAKDRVRVALLVLLSSRHFIFTAFVSLFQSLCLTFHILRVSFSLCCSPYFLWYHLSLTLSH